MAKRLVLLLIVVATVSVSAESAIDYYIRLNMAREEAGLAPVTPLVSLETLAHNYGFIMRQHNHTITGPINAHDYITDRERANAIRQLSSTVGERHIIDSAYRMSEIILTFGRWREGLYTDSFYGWRDSPDHHYAQMHPDVMWIGMAIVRSPNGGAYAVGYVLYVE